MLCSALALFECALHNRHYATISLTLTHIPTHRILHVHKYSCILAVSFFTVQNIYRKYNTNATAKTCSFLKLVTGHCQMVKNNIRFTYTIYFTVKYWVNHFFGEVWIILSFMVIIALHLTRQYMYFQSKLFRWNIPFYNI